MKLFSTAFCILILSISPFCALAQNTEPTRPLHERPILDATKRFERKTSYVMHGKLQRQMHYYLYAPEPPYPEGVKFPLVVILHGSTGFSYAGKYLTEPDMALKYPAFILIPMAPEGALWSYPVQVSNYTQDLPHVIKLIDTLKQNNPIDDKRVYAFGCSMGGYGVFGASSFYDDVFAAGVSISGEWFPDQASQMRKMPLLIMAGSKDTSVPIAKTRSMVNALRAAKAPIIYKEYDMNHNCPAKHFYTDTEWKWLFSKKMQ